LFIFFFFKQLWENRIELDQIILNSINIAGILFQYAQSESNFHFTSRKGFLFAHRFRKNINKKSRVTAQKRLARVEYIGQS